MSNLDRSDLELIHAHLLKLSEDTDIEMAHLKADTVLIAALEAVAKAVPRSMAAEVEQVIAAYRAVPKRYA